jgi:ABC-2 type transport system ATP-binding protein
MTLAIDIRGVTKRYDQHVAVRDLSLQVPAGTVYGLLGPNGAGKTTTIRMILDIIKPDSGTIALFGQTSRAGVVRDRVGYLPEERGLYKKMEVRRVLMFLAELKGLTPREAAPRIDAWLERFTLTTADKDWGKARLDELSRGMQQKVQFIGTMLHEPDLVVLDEPFSGLDPINAQALKDVVVELRQQGRTVIFSTHVMDNAERMCDSVCIIAGGEKVLDGTVSDVRSQHGTRNVALTLGPGARALVDSVLRDTRMVSRFDDHNRHVELELAPAGRSRDLLAALVASGAEIERFELVQPSLHQVFLHRVGAAGAGIEPGMSGHG